MPRLHLPALLAAVLIAACGQPDSSTGQQDSAQTPAPDATSAGQAPDAPPPDAPLPDAPPLEDTRWHLVEVEGKPIAAAAERAQPYIVLFSDQKQAQGFGGCNRMMGAYQHDGDALKFGPLAGTKMACDYPENPEDAFMQALAATARARVIDNQLELSDRNGEVLARLEARKAR